LTENYYCPAKVVTRQNLFEKCWKELIIVFFLDHKLENSNHCKKNLSDLMEKCKKDIPRKNKTDFA
jgi:hypothetical protein